VSPAPQGLHVAPAVPHWLAVCEAYGTHAPPLQHPPGQEIALQTH